MAKQKKYMTMDGNMAAAYTSYAFTEVAGIYPITPSSPMADYVDQWAQQGRKNIFGQTVKVIEMQSEGGAAGVVHGSLNSGALTTTYTASQGLLLMLPNMYKIAGELLPGVFHVSARAVAAHALSIFGDHSDVMAVRQTGFAALSAASVQEAMDMAAVAHLAAIRGRVPFLHFFDGFRTSHEFQKIEVLDYDDLGALVDREALQAFRDRALTPNQPTLRGSAQNPDIFFTAREASNPYYNALPEIVEEYMEAISNLTGRDYKLFNYYGAPDAEYVIVCMGSAVGAVMETVDYLVAKGEKVGLVNVHLYRPFSVRHLLAAMPDTVKVVGVLDRTKEPGAHGEPLYLDVVGAYANSENPPLIVGGRYGLGSRDTTPDQILAVYRNLQAENPRNNFTIGIVDDVTHLSLPIEEHINTTPAGTISCRFWGLGSDGTVGANKNSIKIIGDHTDMSVQAYFTYDSKKSGGITISDLRFGHSPIYSTYLVNQADFVSCSQQAYVNQYDMMSTLKPGGVFLLNTQWTEEELSEHLPAAMRRYLAKNNIRFYTIDAASIAQGLGLGGRTNTVMQAAFFKLANVIPVDEAVEYMKEAIVRSYGHRGEDIIKMNYAAVDAGITDAKQVAVPAEWADAEDESVVVEDQPAFVREIANVINRQDGYSLPVSTFADRADGTMPQGTTQYEKRGIAMNIPVWKPEHCIQCNQCSLVCPHAAIRPFLLTDEEVANAPEGTEVLNGMRPYDNYKFRIQVSALDCTGCGSCAATCPARTKALVMEPLADHLDEAEKWNYVFNLPHKENPMKTANVKASQFNRPLFEFSGACAGCGETPYVKLVTQLFGDRMLIANATGCSSIWGGSAPSQPYTTDHCGRGPAWGNSLFEDNAEYGLGLHLGAKQLRERMRDQLAELVPALNNDQLNEAHSAWVADYDKTDKTIEQTAALVEALEAVAGKSGLGEAEQKTLASILANRDYLSLRSTWIFGGDGWAYDIGYGGLDHVLASGENVNVLVFDTEVYSNTGGQASKATPLGSVAEFAAGGKPVKKKDLGMMAMSYGYVYVAQIAMGASQAHTLRTIAEAEAYNGPSLIIAYAPCISHGIKGGLTISQRREKEAVEVGYWHLYHFDPQVAEGANPFTLDSKEPDLNRFRDFLVQEVRYNSLFKKYDAEHVEEIYARARAAARDRYLSYVRKAAADYTIRLASDDPPASEE